MRAYADFYLTNMRLAVQEQFQYRVGNYFYMIGMVTEPVIYLVVWTTIARASSTGSVGGYTPGKFAAYYIVWTLVRNWNIGLTPFAWEQMIQYGQLSARLLRPMHPIHHDLSYFAGWKFVVFALWLPIAAVLALAFHPVLNPTPLAVLVFFIALWGAYLLRNILNWLLGLVTFWTTRAAAIFQLYMACELVLSGRLVPLSLLPHWAQVVANFLPFQWTFAYPINALIGQLSTQQLLRGLGAQVLWIAIACALVAVCWQASVRRFTSVGN